MVAKACAAVMVERGGANEGNVVVLTPQGEYRRVKLLQAYEARRGTVVRVREGHWKSQFADMRGTVQNLWGQSEHAAVDVLLEDGRSELFWLPDLVVVDGEGDIAV
jgi:hypothetical protein